MSPGHLAAVVAAAVGVFAGSNVDDLIVLVVLFLGCDRGRDHGGWRPWQVVTGQYLGFAALVAASIGIAAGLGFVPDQWIRLLGLVPLALGCWGLVRAGRSGHGDESPVHITGVSGMAALTVISGADNLSIYPALLRTQSTPDATITVVVLLAGVAVWCALAWRLGTHKRVVSALDRVKRWLVPGVLAVLGAVILIGL